MRVPGPASMLENDAGSYCSRLSCIGVRLRHVDCNIVDIFAFVYWQDLDVGGDEKES